ncbi:hypothetical protein ACTZN5_23685, partial [Klebsiella pneumoniae]
CYLNGDLPTEDFHLISQCPCRAYTKKPEEDHLPWQIILFRFCPRIAVATLIQPLLARIKQKT